MIENSINKVIWNELLGGKDIKFEDCNEYNVLKIDPITVTLSKNITDRSPIRYSFNNDYIDFKPIGIKWDSGTFIKTKNTTEVSSGSHEFVYHNIIGNDIDLKIESDNFNISKNIYINNLESLGEIPEDSQFLEIYFKINSNFLDSLNILDYLKIENKIEIGDIKILPVKAWDSSPISFKNGESFLNINYDDFAEGYFIKHKGVIYLVKRLSIKFIKEAIFPIVTDLTLTFGNISVLNTSGYVFSTPKIIFMSSTNLLVAVCIRNSFAYVYHFAATISGNTLTWGNMYNSGGQQFSDIKRINDTTFVSVTFSPGTGGIIRTGTVSGTVVTINSGSVLTSSISAIYDIVVLSSTKIIVTWYYYTQYIVACSLSGSTFTVGTPINTNEYGSTAGRLDRLSDTTFSYIITKSGGLNYSYYCTVSGTTISIGSGYNLHATYTASNLYSTVINGYILATYYEYTSGIGYVQLGSLSGSVYTWYTPISIGSGNVPQGITSLSSTNFITCYLNSSSYGYITIGILNGTSISFETPQLWKGSANSMCEITESLTGISGIAIVFSDTNNNSYPSVIMGIYSTGKKINAITYVKWDGTAITKWNNQ